MAIKWVRQDFEWGVRHISPDTDCLIEDHNTHGVKLWYEPGRNIRRPQSFETVRAAKRYVNQIANQETTP